ncbi:MAG: DUF4345 family protein [Gammaproteobacteria bacterium]|jgi:hypothetical protein|nr:DUF4345 family protein [Gammaproteobacteria bacterium]|tara:strand:+ start:181 stop:567 length:387 start_codon:yes stop_codon:yes gene_type:complete
MKNSMIDTVLLTLIGLEYLGFGLIGLVNPNSAAALVGFSLNELISLSEIRANYSFFVLLGLMSLISLKKKSLQKITYLIVALLCGSYVFGRLVSIVFDGMPDTRALWMVLTVDLIVFILSFCRYKDLS